MPAWLLAALAMIRTITIGGTGRALTTGAVASTAVARVGGDGFIGPLPLPGFLGGGDHPHQRRRRKRALTASDKVDIAFLAGLLGPKAGKDLAVIIAAKP